MPATHGDTLKTTLSWNAAGIGLALNVFVCKINQTGAPHTVVDGDLRDDMETWMEACVLPLEHDIVVSYEVTGILIHKRVGADWVYVTSGIPVISPDNGTDPLPSGVAALITVATDASKVRGRKFIPGLSDAALVAGAWTVGILAHMAACAAAWITPFISVDPETQYYPGVWSNSLGGFIPFAPRILVPDIPAYQRRRKEGVGA